MKNISQFELSCILAEEIKKISDEIKTMEDLIIVPNKIRGRRIEKFKFFLIMRESYLMGYSADIKRSKLFKLYSHLIGAIDAYGNFFEGISTPFPSSDFGIKDTKKFNDHYNNLMKNELLSLIKNKELLYSDNNLKVREEHNVINYTFFDFYRTMSQIFTLSTGSFLNLECDVYMLDKYIDMLLTKNLNIDNANPLIRDLILNSEVNFTEIVKDYNLYGETLKGSFEWDENKCKIRIK